MKIFERFSEEKCKGHCKTGGKRIVYQRNHLIKELARLGKEVVNLLKNGSLEEEAMKAVEGKPDLVYLLFDLEACDMLASYLICLSLHLSSIAKSKGEVPVEAKVAVASLVYAATRIPWSWTPAGGPAEQLTKLKAELDIKYDKVIAQPCPKATCGLSCVDDRLSTCLAIREKTFIPEGTLKALVHPNSKHPLKRIAEACKVEWTDVLASRSRLSVADIGTPSLGRTDSQKRRHWEESVDPPNKHQASGSGLHHRAHH